MGKRASWNVRDLPDAIGMARERLARERGHVEVSAALERAVVLATHGTPWAERVESLGGGWVAEEALAIGVYCALVAGDDFERGMRLAVNHGGDSDSTGAITGNLLGAALGVGVIPQRWLEALELRDVIEQLADDLLIGYERSEDGGGGAGDAPAAGPFSRERLTPPGFLCRPP